ncbi:ClpP/crotonase-like domain-containing protein [Thamnocephalis sphaerospora]|uniref:ClpP/crotonase-like domain-containing protein n=1 Tax=Thamnocephalis sphaerospora TaxID=78915 RepID=A0A4P9XS31_9FUNG|nr:ClpP/crotonase-like domain-containing protein [Thamnocephalis sphaerospora]|eukprot:RKP08908.1 ClpP/crotonase-like domain-containing protein [Thamnocephalis sphaerospora]
MTQKLTEPLPPTKYCLLQLAAPHTLLITLNRPAQRNALHLPAHHELAAVFDYVEREPELWCSVITGAGEKSFCAGADIKPITGDAAGNTTVPTFRIEDYPVSGFGGLSRRAGSRKPVIAAVQGHAFGGGMEILLACDIVVATERATFAMPEVKRGIVAANGGIARLVRIVGYQRAMSILITGRVLSAREAKEYGFVNELAQNKKEAIKTALAYARLITTASPDAVGCTKLAANWALESSTLEATRRLIESDELRQLSDGENLKEGVRAFKERRHPRWQSSKL